MTLTCITEEGLAFMRERIADRDPIWSARLYATEPQQKLARWQRLVAYFRGPSRYSPPPRLVADVPVTHGRAYLSCHDPEKRGRGVIVDRVEIWRDDLNAPFIVARDAQGCRLGFYDYIELSDISVTMDAAIISRA